MAIPYMDLVDRPSYTERRSSTASDSLALARNNSSSSCSCHKYDVPDAIGVAGGGAAGLGAAASYAAAHHIGATLGTVILPGVGTAIGAGLGILVARIAVAIVTEM